MKFFAVATSVILLASSAIAVVDDWRLTLYMENGGVISAYGEINSGPFFGSNCVNWIFNVTRSPVNRVAFIENQFADTFELYEEKECNPPLGFRQGQGSHTVTPSKFIQSYKVY